MTRSPSPASPATAGPEEAQPAAVAVHCVEAVPTEPELVPSPPLRPASASSRRWNLEDTDAWWIAGGRGRRLRDRSQPSAPVEPRATSQSDKIFDALDINQDGVISRSEFNRALANVDDAEESQEIQHRAVSVDTTRARASSADPRSASPPGPRTQPSSTGTVVLVPVRPSSGRSGRLSARHRDAIVRAGVGLAPEPVRDLTLWTGGQRLLEPETASGLRDMLPPAAARMAEEVLNQEVEGLSECLHICAQRSRTLKLLGFQHLHYDARLQSILKSKAQKLGLTLVSELLLLARGLFAFREAARHGFLWERLQGRERCLATTTRDAAGLRNMHQKARLRVRNQMDRSSTLAERSLLQYCFADFVRHVQEEKLSRLSISNCALMEESMRHRQKVIEALTRHFQEKDQQSTSWCFNAWVSASVAARSEVKWQQQYAGMALRMISNSGEALLSQSFSAWVQEVHQTREEACKDTKAARQKRSVAATLERQFAAANELLLLSCFGTWRGEHEQARETKRKQDERVSQAMRLIACTDEVLLANCFNAFVVALKDAQVDEANRRVEEGLTATRKRYLGTYFRHFVINEEVLMHSALVGWFAAAKKSHQEKVSQKKIAGLIHRAYRESDDVILQQVLNAWELETDRAKHEWLMRVRTEQMQEQLNMSRSASKSIAVKQATRIEKTRVAKTTEMFFTAWGGLCENVRTKKKTLTRDLALAQRTLAGTDEVLLIQAFCGWAHVAGEEKHAGQVDLALRREEMTRANSKAAIHRQCARGLVEFDHHLLDVYFVHWESIAERSRINRKRLQQNLALAARALSNSTELLMHLAFTCWAEECELSKLDGKLKRATDRLQQIRAASKSKAAKQCNRTFVSLEQEISFTLFRSWMLAVEKAKDVAKRKKRDMAHALVVIAASELTIVSSLFHGWHQLTKKEAHRTKSKRQAHMHLERRISVVDEALLASLLNSWGQVVAVARAGRLLAEKGELQARVEQGRAKTKVALHRQFCSGDNALLRTVLASWRVASLAAAAARRRKDQSLARETRSLDAHSRAVMAQCFVALASEAAAFKAERNLQDANGRIQDLTQALASTTNDKAFMMQEITRHRQSRLTSMSRFFLHSDEMQRTTFFHAWASGVATMRAYTRRKEKGLNAGRRMAEHREVLLLKEVLFLWLRDTEHAKAAVRLEALKKRMELETMATGQGIKHQQQCLIMALKWQFDTSETDRLQTCFKGWRGFVDRRRRSLTRREEFAARAVRMLVASNESLLAVYFATWQGAVKESKRLRMVMDKAACSRSKLVDSVERLVVALAKATRLSTFAAWSVEAMTSRRRQQQKERITRRLHDSMVSANESLLMLCLDSWCRAIVTGKYERTAEANSRLEQANVNTAQKAAALMQKTMGALSKQFACSDHQMMVNSFNGWSEFIHGMKKKAEQKGRIIMQIMGSNEALLAHCFFALVRHKNESQIEQARRAKQEAEEAAALAKLMSRQQHLESLSVQLAKSDDALLHLVVNKWSSCIASKRSKEESSKVAMMWIASSGEGFLGSVFREWEREVNRTRQERRSKEKSDKVTQNLMALQQRQLMLSDQQFSSLAFREWTSWASSTAKTRKLRMDNAARFLRSLAAADGMILSDITRKWHALVRQEKQMRNKRERVRVQALDRMAQAFAVVLSRSFDGWHKEASHVVRGKLKKANGKIEEAKARSKQQAESSRHKALAALERQHKKTLRQARFAILCAWRAHTDHVFLNKRCKEKKITQVNATDAAHKSARLAQCFYSWVKEACDSKREKQLAEARTQVQKASERADELNATALRRKDVRALNRHFVHTTKGPLSMCWTAWTNYCQDKKENAKRREENVARTLRSINSAGKSLLIFALSLWHSEAKYERRERVLLEASQKCEDLTAKVVKGAAKKHDRTVSTLERQFSRAKDQLSYWSFHCWHDGAVQSRDQWKLKKDLKSRCLERIAIAMQATKSTCLLLWSCATARVVLERNLLDSTRHSEDRQSAYVAAERSRRKYLDVLLRQRAETDTSLALACFSAWARVAYAMRQTSRKKAWAHVVAERVIAGTRRGLLEQCFAVWGFFQEKGRHERRIEHFLQDMSERANSEVEVANQRVRVAGACVDEVRKAQAHTKGRTKERALSVAMRSVALRERALRAKSFLSWCSANLAARTQKAGEQKCKELRGLIVRRARTAAGFSRRWLDAVVLAQCVGLWRLCTSLGLQLRQQQKIQRGSFTKACANIVKLRLRLHEQKFLYQWVQICPFKTKEPPALFRIKSPDFAQEPPPLYSRPASAREPRWCGLDREPEPAPSPAPSPAPGLRPASAVEGRRRQAVPADEVWKPWAEAKPVNAGGSTQSFVCGKLALTDQGGTDSQKELTQLLEAERACAEGAAAAASATAALALASAANAGPQRPSSAIGAGDRYQLARHAMVSDLEYRRLLEQNRREIRDSRAERESENAPRFVGWGVWRP